MIKFREVVLACAICSAAVGGQAATPEAGQWAVNGELNGSPGRGFQFDVQNGVLVFTYYGYKPDGSPVFYLASGPFVNGAFEGDLIGYEGGTAIGGAFRDGRPTENMGRMHVSFTSSTQGELTLPGEQRKRVSRFSFSSVAPLLNRTFDGNTYGGSLFGDDSSTYTYSLKDGALNLVRTAFFAGTCRYTGTYWPAGKSLESSGTYQCADFTSGTYRAERLTVDENGLYTGVFRHLATGTTAEYVEVHNGR